MGNNEQPSVEERLDVLEDKVTSIQKTLAGASATPSADLVKKYQGKRVRIFLETGTIVSGDVQFDGHWADVNNQQARKSALCNMSHVVSITKDEG